MKSIQLGRIINSMKAYKHFVWISILCSLISVAGQLAVPVFCGRAIDSMTGENSVSFDTVMINIAYICTAALVSAFAEHIMTISNNGITYGVSRDLRNAALRKINKLPLSYLDSHPTGDLLSRVIGDIDTFAEGILMGFSQLFTGAVTIIGILLIMLSYNFTVTILVVVLTPLSLLAAWFISKSTGVYFERQASARGRQTALINELIDSQKLIEAYCRGSEAIADFDKTNLQLSEVGLKAIFFSSLTNPVTRLINNIVYAAVALAGALYAILGGVTIGQLSVFLSYASQYAKPFNEISAVVTELQNAASCIGRVFEFLDEEEQSDDKESSVVLDRAERKEVEFRNVYFSYSSERPLIEDISLRAVQGQRVAIVGPTGCGKTTLINLLMRFYDVSGGLILVNNTDIRELSRKSLRSNYGIVLQETWLRSGTIKENIAYGRPDASEEEIISAAKLAYADSFIRRLPYGYDTVIGEGSEIISAGQRQLLCIARVMLYRPPMLILDEATSSVDTRTEAKIQSAFAELMKGRTSFIVAHRLSTIREADLILVMKDGGIKEQGTHDQLLGTGGLYATLYNSQFES